MILNISSTLVYFVKSRLDFNVNVKNFKCITILITNYKYVMNIISVVIFDSTRI